MEILLNEVTLTNVRIAYADAKNKTGRKIYAEFRERKKNPTLLNVLNAGDARFNSGGSVRAWIIAEPEQFYKLFNIPQDIQQSLSTMPISSGMKASERVEGIHKLTLNVKNPKIGETPIRVQVIETTTRPTPTTAPKINPSTGELLMFNGEPIYRTSSVVLGEPKDVFIAHNSVLAKASTPAVQAAITAAAQVAGA